MQNKIMSFLRTKMKNNYGEVSVDEYMISKPHPFIAGISDLYIADIYLRAVIATVLSLFNIVPGIQNLGLFSLIVGLAFWVAAIIYHKFIAKRIHFLSPGEIIAGKRIISNEKVWTNQFGFNRFFIFAFSFLLFIVTSNHWNKIFNGYLYSIKDLLVHHLNMNFVVLLVVLTCSGNMLKYKTMKKPQPEE